MIDIYMVPTPPLPFTEEELQKDLAKYDAEDSESSDDDDSSKKEKGTHGEKTTGRETKEGGLIRELSSNSKATFYPCSFWPATPTSRECTILLLARCRLHCIL